MANQELERPQLEKVARLFGVLSEPTRLAILQKLRSGPLPVKDLVEALQAKQANVSKQLGILYDAGLVERRRDAGMVLYSIREPMIFELCHLVCDKLRRDAEAQVESLRHLGSR